MRLIRTGLFLMMVALLVFFQQRATYAATPEGDAAEVVQSDPAGKLLGLHCVDQACSFAMDLGDVTIPAVARTGASILFETLKDNVAFLPDDAALSITDELLLKMPVGELKLLNAELTLQMGPDNQVERLRGTAQLPFPTFGIFDDVQVVTPALAGVGLDKGANLRHLNAPLDPERSYLFFDIGAGLDVRASQRAADGSVHQFGISVPQGQRATLIVDPQAPFVYVAGNVTLSHSEQLAFVGDLLTTADGWLPLPADLPIVDRTGVYVAGLFTDDLDESYLQIGASHGIHGGALGDWLGVDLSPITAEGLLTLSRSGIQLNSVARSYLQPDRYFDGQLSAEVYVPFSRNWTEAYVAVDGEAAVPMAGLYARGDVWMDGGLQALASGELVTPWSHDQSAVASAPSSSVEPTATDRDGWAPMAGMRSTVRNAAGATVQAAETGYAAARNGVARGYDWTVDGTANAYRAVEDTTVQGWHAAGNLWCGATGWCEDESPEAVAQAGE